MELDLKRTIKDKKLLKQSLGVFIVVILGFVTNSITNIGLAVIAIFGAAVLVFLSGKKPEEIFVKVEWDTLFFFGGLFILVEGVENLGVIKTLGEHIIRITEGSLEMTSSLILILSTILSPIIGSIPHTLSFGKIIAEILPGYTGNTEVLWWALSTWSLFGRKYDNCGSCSKYSRFFCGEKSRN